jgi:hypothetical protein
VFISRREHRFVSTEQRSCLCLGRSDGKLEKIQDSLIREISRDVARCHEMSRDVARCRQIRCGYVQSKGKT